MLTLFFFKLIFIGGELLYNVVLAPAVQQRESAVHIHTPLTVAFPSHVSRYRALRRIPCPIQYVPVSYLGYTYLQGKQMHFFKSLSPEAPVCLLLMSSLDVTGR